jgi:hypothetical protein
LELRFDAELAGDGRTQVNVEPDDLVALFELVRRVQGVRGDDDLAGVLDAAERAGRVGVLAGGEGGDSEQGGERRRAQAADAGTGAQSVLLWTEVTGMGAS